MFEQLHGNKITALYCRLSRDDGFSGTNFDRPDFTRMISMCEDNLIGTLMVKDLSRLGREYLRTGYYTEIFFPLHDVRFIAINDGVDSANGDNEFAPFKNIINASTTSSCTKRIQQRDGVETGLMFTTSSSA